MWSDKYQSTFGNHQMTYFTSGQFWKSWDIWLSYLRQVQPVRGEEERKGRRKEEKWTKNYEDGWGVREDMCIKREEVSKYFRPHMVRRGGPFNSYYSCKWQKSDFCSKNFTGGYKVLAITDWGMWEEIKLYAPKWSQHNTLSCSILSLPSNPQRVLGMTEIVLMLSRR